MLEFLIGSIACFRLAEMLSSEEGPAGVFRIIRRKVPARTNAGRGIRCFNCWSVWIAAVLGLYGVWMGVVGWQAYPVAVFAVSGAAMLLNRATDH